MEREAALLKYQEKIDERLMEYRSEMGMYLMERSEQLEEMVKGAMDSLGERMKEKGKEYVSFLSISLLKINLIQHRYQFLLHAMNMQWYLDEEPIEVYFDAKDLFSPFEEFWNFCIEASYEFRGIVNSYDIQHILFEELKYIDGTISKILRYRLREWEMKGIMQNVTLSPYFLLKWGEYRDQTEFILQVDRVTKEESIWKGDLKKANHKPETMIFSYWYRGQYKGSQAKNLDMTFIVLEECSLSDAQFVGCNMEGSRFPKSNLSNCTFENCNLWGADFTGCTFENVSFRGSELTAALFPEESIPFLNLSPEQLQNVLLKTREEEQ